LMLAMLAVAMLGSERLQRRIMLSSALATVPFTILVVVSVPGYWRPARIVDGRLSPEDIVFTCAAGGLSWWLASLPWRRQLTVALAPRASAWRFMRVALGGGLLALGAALPRFKPMTAMLLPMAIIGAVLVGVRRDLWRLLVAGMLGYALVHVAVTAAAFAITPHYANAWISDDLWGPIIWRIPLDEIVWPLAFGAVWPLVIAYILDIRLPPRGTEACLITPTTT